MLNTSQGTTHSAGGGTSRRVQFPAELPGSRGETHVAIDMAASGGLQRTPSRNLASPGASAELARALEAAAENTTDDEDDLEREPRYPGSGPASRAASSDGDPNERLEELKDQMEVFVDPGERDGLPSVSRRKPEEANAKAAWSLVRGLTLKNQQSSLRRRNKGGADAPAGFSSGTGANADNEKADDASIRSDSRVGGFIDRLKEGNVQDIPPQANFSSAGIGSGGILSALIALQQQQQQRDSPTASGSATPSSMGPASRAGSIHEPEGDFSDEEEEEAERLKFLAKLHEKRAQKNRLHHLAEGFGSGAQGVAVGVTRGAQGVATGVGRGAQGVATGVGRGAGAVVSSAGRAVGGVGSAFGVKPTSKSKTPSVDATPATGEEGEAKKREKKGLFIRTGDDAPRPHSSVFGGLVAGTVRSPPTDLLTP